MDRPSTLRQHLPGLTCAATLVVALLAAPTPARADFYRYLQKDGSELVTNSPRKGLKLLEHIRDGGDSGGGGGGGGGRTISAKHQAAKDRAIRQRDAHAQGGTDLGDASQTRESRYDHYIREAADAYGLPFAFIKGVIKVESNFNPLVVSPVGAQGLMQLMPATADFLGVQDPFDPRQNIMGGAKLLSLLTRRYNGDINLVLSGYNAGEGAVDRYDGIPYAQTREYVRRCYYHYKQYQRQEVEVARD